MRILSIRFQNLNSLVGEWSIDLTHPAYGQEGIFAITGPTGAGKSTLLDAICLALYGRTPRLDRITQSENEIMSRQTGECFAEVTFSCLKGVFRCHWAQRRARKSPEGALQQATHEISNADTGEVLETRRAAVLQHIELLTGMDYQRFTRSVLLAQGGFAAFLEASPDDRAPLLEQITGTEIYSRISQLVHEIKSEEQKKCDVLQAELASLQLLSAEQEVELQAELTRLRVLLDENTKALKHAQTVQQWRQRLLQLQQTLEEQQQALLQANQEKDAQQPQRQRLQQALKALELNADYSALGQARLQLSAATQQLTQTQNLLQEEKKRHENLLERQKRAKEQHSEQEVAADVNTQKVRQARGLDSQITSTQASLTETTTARAALFTRLQANQQAHEAAKAEKLTLDKAVQEHQRYLEQNNVDASLSSELKALVQSKNLWLEHEEKAQQLQQKISALQDHLRTQQTAQAAAEKQVLALRKEHEAQQHALDLAQQAVSQHVQSESVKVWYTKLDDLRQQQQRLANGYVAYQRWQKSQAAIAEKHKLQADLNLQLQNVNERLEALAPQLELSEKLITSLETQYSYALHIQSYEEQRAQLQTDTPCPLCGSKEHPYVTTYPVNPTDSAAELEAAHKAKREQQQAQQALLLSKQEVKIALSSTTTTLTQLTEEQVQLQQHWQQAIAPNVLESWTVEEAAWQPLLDRTQQLLSSYQEKITIADTLASTLAQQQVQVKHAEDQLREAERDLLQRESAVRNAESEKKLYNEQQQTIQNTVEKSREAFCVSVAAYNIAVPSREKVETVLSALSDREARWRHAVLSMHEATRKLATIEESLKQYATHETQDTKALLVLDERLTVLHMHLETLQQQHRQLLGDVSTDAFEQATLSSFEQSKKILHEVDKAAATKQAEVSRITSEAAQQSLQVESLVKELAVREQGFVTALRAHGFPDESSYVQACLATEERTALTQAIHTVNMRIHQLQHQLNNTQQQLEEEERKALSNEALDVLTLELNTLEEQKERLQQQYWQCNHRLEKNSSIKQQQQKQLDLLQKQQVDLEEWALLHTLIGSADGKKFRNFAQGLTFELVVAQANQQLQKMTDRYLLLRNSDAPLELNVMDNYQAGEQRSTKNLSGGESFIVSMALALGLASMQSDAIRVDSLFLDEGFGTLDEDALDIALDTLSNLQHSGKLIGIISHVTALKERISTQITVQPSSNGNSVLQGPGCARC